MSVVIMGHLVVSYASFMLLIPACAIAGLIGYSRLYARSRFVYQVVSSWATGLFGLYVGLRLCQKINFDRYACTLARLVLFCLMSPCVPIYCRMIQRNYMFCIMISIGCLFCHFMLCAENNDSRLMYLSRKEFIRVISDIISPLPQTSVDATKLEAYEEDDEDAADESHRVRFLPDDEPTPSIPIRKRKNQNKRDSFFFLQRSLERRSGLGVDNNNSAL